VEIQVRIRPIFFPQPASLWTTGEKKIEEPTAYVPLVSWAELGSPTLSEQLLKVEALGMRQPEERLSFNSSKTSLCSALWCFWSGCKQNLSISSFDNPGWRSR